MSFFSLKSGFLFRLIGKLVLSLTLILASDCIDKITSPNEITIAFAQEAASTDGNPSLKLTTLLLKTKKLKDVTAIEKLVKDSGGRVLTYLPPNILRVKITDETAETLLAHPLVEEITFESIDERKHTRKNGKIRKAIRFNNLIQQEREIIQGSQSMVSGDEEPLSDIVVPPPEAKLSDDERKSLRNKYKERWKSQRHNIKKNKLESLGLEDAQEENTSLIAGAPGDEGLPGSGPDDAYFGTSLYMTGRIAVGMFFLSGSRGGWTTSAMDATFVSTVAAMELYAEDDPNANIEIVPIMEISPDGFPLGTPVNDRDYLNDLRNVFGTNWAYLIETYYGNGRAWANVYGPKHILYYDDLRSGYVARHEVGHVFGAMDQYNPDAARSPLGRWGYLQIVNANSQYNNGTGYFSGAGESQSDIMISQTGNRNFGVFTRGQLGWRDSDGDGIFDPLDTYPDTALNNPLTSSSSNSLTIIGQTKDMPLRNEDPSASYLGNVTVNTINRIEYRINNRSWMEAMPEDGELDTDHESFTFQTPTLPNGTYTIEARSTNSVGNTELLPAKINVTINMPGNPVTDSTPFPHFTVSAEETSIDASINLDPSASSDLEDTTDLLRVRWDQDNDGTFESEWLPLSSVYTVSYPSSGIKTITMEVQDSTGKVSTLTRDVTIGSTNLPPTAKFKATPAQRQGTSSHPVTVDASESYDPEDIQNLSVRWQFSTGGTWTSWQNFSTGKIQNFTYTVPSKSKIWWVTLEVKDSAGVISSAKRAVWAIKYNKPPTLVDFTGTYATGKMSLTNITYTDPNNGKVWDPYREVRFDYNSDGTWDTDFMATQSIFEFIPESNLVRVTGQIRDSYDATHSLTKEFQVAANIPPKLNPINNGTFIIGNTISFPVSAIDPDGDPLTFALEPVSGPSVSAVLNSHMIDHGNGTATFTWDTDNAAPGNYSFNFKVQDSNGQSDIRLVNLSLTWLKHDIIWTDLVGVTPNLNSITKYAATGWGNGGAASTARFNGDGGIEFTATQVNTNIFLGLSKINTNADYPSIEFAIYLDTAQKNIGRMRIYESGNLIGSAGTTFTIGDVFAIERINGQVFYKKNGVVIYLSGKTTLDSLLADAAIYSQNGTISNAKIMGIEPQVPTVSAITAVPDNGTVRLDWKTAPNGSPILRHRIQYGTVASGTFPVTVQDDVNPGATINGLSNGVEYEFRVYADNEIGSSLPVIIRIGPNTRTNVEWTNPVGVTVTGNTITKTAPEGINNGGAASTATFSGNGGVEFTAVQTNTTVICGLSKNNIDAGWIIDFAIDLKSGENANQGWSEIWEGSTYIGALGSFKIGDVFSIERVGTKIIYRKNGVPVYSSSKTSTGKLLVDSSIITQGGTISNTKFIGLTVAAPGAINDLQGTPQNNAVNLTWSVPANNGLPITGYEVQYGTVASGSFVTVVQDDAVPGITISNLTNGVEYQFKVIAKNAQGSGPSSNIIKIAPILKIPATWADVFGVTPSGNTLSKTAVTGWGNAGAVSSINFDGEGGVEFTAYRYAYAIVGLSSTNIDNNYTSVEFGIYLTEDFQGVAEVFESGVSKGKFGRFLEGDVFAIERTGSTIVYKKNGTVFYTSTKTSSGKLMVDTAIHQQFGFINNVNITGITLNAPGQINDLRGMYNDRAVSLSWSAPANNGSPITNYRIEYGTSDFSRTLNTPALSNILITNLLNDTEYQFRVVAQNAHGTSISSNVIKITPRSIIPVSWTSPVGVTIFGNSITKFAAAGWGNGGAISSMSFNGNGGVEFTADSTATQVMAGLAKVNPDTNFTSIEHAIYMRLGAIKVYENGTLIGSFENFKTGDVFLIERTGTIVVYKKNGLTFYTSAKSSSGNVFLDTAIYTLNGMVSNANIVGVTIKEPEAVTDLTANASDQNVKLSWSAPANNGSPLTGYEIQYGTVSSGAFGTVVQDDTVAGVSISGLTNGLEYQFKVFARNALGTSLASNVVRATPDINTDVTWSTPVNVAVSGNTITKNAGGSAWNAGAVSSTAFSGDNGVQFTATSTATQTMCGLSKTNPDANYTSIEFAIYMSLGTIQVRESGTSMGNFGTYQAGDTLSIERLGSTILYKKNSQTFYVSTKSSTGNLLVDASLYQQGAAISNVKIVVAQANAPSAVSDLGAVSSGGSVQLAWTAPANGGAAITGYEVQYGTVAGGAFSTVLQASATPGITISNLINGTEYQFRVIAKNSVGNSPVSNVVRATPILKTDVTWVNLVGVTATGNSITKVSTSNTWGTGGAVSSQSIAGDGSAEFIAGQTTHNLMAGLSRTNQDAGYTSIEFAIYFQAAGTIQIRESGTSMITLGSYTTGDVFSIERRGTTITYKKNGALIYTSTKSSSGNLLLDAAIYTTGGNLNNAKFTGVSP